jgi:glutathione S-transferase
MSPIVSLVTIAALLVLVVVTLNVGRSRVKFGIKAPQMSGDPAFERAVRVHQNTLEQIVIFLPALWIFANFVQPIAAAILGSIWVIGRILYAWGYYQAAEKRGPGFGIAFLATVILLLGSIGGIGVQLSKSLG